MSRISVSINSSLGNLTHLPVCCVNGINDALLRRYPRPAGLSVLHSRQIAGTAQLVYIHALVPCSTVILYAITQIVHLPGELTPNRSEFAA